jgi:hypothetical protein
MVLGNKLGCADGLMLSITLGEKDKVGIIDDSGFDIEAGLAVVRVCTGDPVMAGDHDRVWLGLTFGTMDNVGFVVPLGTWESEGKKEGKMDELGP